MCDSVNHTCFPKEDHLPDWVYQDKHGKNGDRVYCIPMPSPTDDDDWVYHMFLQCKFNLSSA